MMPIKHPIDSFMAPDKSNPWYAAAVSANSGHFDRCPDQIIRSVLIGLNAYMMQPYKGAHDRLAGILEARKAVK